MFSDGLLELDLGKERKESESRIADGVAGLRLSHDGGATDVVAEVINVDSTGNFSLYDRVENLFFHTTPGQLAISFNLEAGHRSYLLLKNTTNRSAKVRVLLDYEGGNRPYDVLLENIPRQQMKIVDIQQLRDAGVPDRNGQKLPKNLSFGGARIFSEPGAIVASDPTCLLRIGPDSEEDGEEGGEVAILVLTSKPLARQNQINRTLHSIDMWVCIILETRTRNSANPFRYGGECGTQGGRRQANIKVGFG